MATAAAATVETASATVKDEGAYEPAAKRIRYDAGPEHAILAAPTTNAPSDNSRSLDVDCSDNGAAHSSGGGGAAARSTVSDDNQNAITAFNNTPPRTLDAVTDANAADETAAHDDEVVIITEGPAPTAAEVGGMWYTSADMVPISDTEIVRIMQGLDIISRLGVADAFRHAVAYKKTKQYMKDIAYPVDLQLIRTRLRQSFYRRKAALLWEIKMLAENCAEFNDPASEIAKCAEVIRQAATRLVREQSIEDIVATCPELVEHYGSELGEASDPDERDEVLVAGKDQTPLSIAEAEEVDIRVLMYVNRYTIGKMVEPEAVLPKGTRVLIPTNMDLEKGAQELSEDERSSEEESQDDGSIDGEDNGEEDRLPVYYAEDDETIEYIAVKHEVDGKELLKLNKRKHVGLTLKANLEEGTEILLPLTTDPMRRSGRKGRGRRRFDDSSSDENFSEQDGESGGGGGPAYSSDDEDEDEYDGSDGDGAEYSSRRNASSSRKRGRSSRSRGGGGGGGRVLRGHTRAASPRATRRKTRNAVSDSSGLSNDDVEDEDNVRGVGVDYDSNTEGYPEYFTEMRNATIPALADRFDMDKKDLMKINKGRRHLTGLNYKSKLSKGTGIYVPHEKASYFQVAAAAENVAEDVLVVEPPEGSLSDNPGARATLGGAELHRVPGAWQPQALERHAKLMQLKNAEWFNIPADPEEFPDYAEKIENPMDLGAVCGKLSRREYKTPEEYAEDVRLVFTNAHIYNCDNPAVIDVVTDMSNYFEDNVTAGLDTLPSSIVYEAAADSTLDSEILMAHVTSIHKTLMSLMEAKPFLVAVPWKKMGLVNYLTVIKKPMDLGTISNTLQDVMRDGPKRSRGGYQKLSDWVSDVLLVFENAVLFNAPDDPVTLAALTLKVRFEQYVRTAFGCNPDAGHMIGSADEQALVIDADPKIKVSPKVCWAPALSSSHRCNHRRSKALLCMPRLLCLQDFFIFWGEQRQAHMCISIS